MTKPYISDKNWFAARPKRTHRIRKPNSNEGYSWAEGSTHVLVQRMLVAGSFAKVPVNLKQTCKHCLLELEAVTDMEEESILDCNIYHLMRWAIAPQRQHGSKCHLTFTIEHDFEVGMRRHSLHPQKPIKPPKYPKTGR